MFGVVLGILVGAWWLIILIVLIKLLLPFGFEPLSVIGLLDITIAIYLEVNIDCYLTFGEGQKLKVMLVESDLC